MTEAFEDRFEKARKWQEIGKQLEKIDISEIPEKGLMYYLKGYAKALEDIAKNNGSSSSSSSK